MKRYLISAVLFFVVASVFYAGPSGTIEEMKAFERGGKRNRPDREFFIDSQDGRFRLWYDTTGYNAVESLDTLPADGIPDYVQRAEEYLQRAYEVQVDSLGFRAPYPDSSTIWGSNDVGGDDRYDVYFSRQNNYYGSTTPDYSVDSLDYNFSTGFMTFNTQMRGLHPEYNENPYPALAVTCAHEFFHMVQFRYNSDLDKSWMLECTAVFMEEFVYDEINDYYFYLDRFQESPETPLTESYPYGAVLFPIYLYENFGVEIIKLWWEYAQERDILPALEYALEHYETSMEEQFPIFCSHKFMTGIYFTGDGLSEASYYVEPYVIDLDISEGENAFNIEGELEGQYCCNYYKDSRPYYRQGSEGVANIQISVDVNYANEWAMLYSGMSDFGNDFNYIDEIMDVNDFLIDSVWDYGEIFYTPIRLMPNSGAYSINVVKVMDSNIILSSDVFEPYPNPVERDRFIHFPFDLDEDGEGLLLIYDAAGSLVFEEELGYSLGKHRVEGALSWETRGVASGMYMYKIILPNSTKKGTFVVK